MEKQNIRIKLRAYDNKVKQILISTQQPKRDFKINRV